MTDAIPYEEMRRILALPVRRTRISAPWAIRKLDAGVHVGHWGVLEGLRRNPSTDRRPPHAVTDATRSRTMSSRRTTADVDVRGRPGSRRRNDKSPR
ncbi:hypothetical protein GS436_15360 [Rhodococcus hoagii]|nr:hypothetical protein [Prescottella equi]